jgi:signal transduction histidine kinase
MMAMDRGSDVPLPEAVTRTVRHEVGDLLQSLYATVTLLQQRLPPGAELEQRLLGDLRGRAERCRDLLDTVLDLLLPPPLMPEVIDLAAVTTGLVREAAVQNPHLDVRAEITAVPPVQGDPHRIAQAGRFLLLHACRNARQNVLVRIGPAAQPHEVAWEFRDNGPPLTDAQLERLFVPFATPREGLVQVGAAFAGQTVSRHGGRVSAQNLPGGGVKLLALLPVRSVEQSENDEGTFLIS